MIVSRVWIGLSAIVVAVTFITIPFIVFAEVAEVATPSIKDLMDSVNDRNWPIAISIGLTMLVWLLRNLVNDVIPKEYLPHLTLAIAVFTEVSLRVAQYAGNNQVWWHGVIYGVMEGIMVGLCAMGVWSVGAKRLPIRKKK